MKLRAIARKYVIYTPEPHTTVADLDIIIKEITRRLKYCPDKNAIVLDMMDIGKITITLFTFSKVLSAEKIAEKLQEAKDGVAYDGDENAVVIFMKPEPEPVWYPGKFLTRALDGRIGAYRQGRMKRTFGGGKSDSDYEVYELQSEYRPRFSRQFLSECACRSYSDVRRTGRRKTYREWQGSRLDMDRFLQVGDEVDEEFADYFRDVLPPETFTSTMIQIGEPYDINDNGPTYSTIEKIDGKWVYAGHQNSPRGWMAEQYYESHADTRTIDERIEAYRQGLMKRGMKGQKLDDAVAVYAAKLRSTSASHRFRTLTNVAVLRYRDSLEKQGLPKDEIERRVKNYQEGMTKGAEKFHDTGLEEPEEEPVPGRGYATYESDALTPETISKMVKGYRQTPFSEGKKQAYEQGLWRRYWEEQGTLGSVVRGGYATYDGRDDIYVGQGEYLKRRPTDDGSSPPSYGGGGYIMSREERARDERVAEGKRRYWAIQEAAEQGNLSLIKEYHFWGHATLESLYDAMFVAIRKGHVEMMQWLYEHGVTRNRDQLVWAAMYNQLGSVQWLYEHGDTSQSSVRSARRAAVEKGYHAIVKWLDEQVPPQGYATYGPATERILHQARRTNPEY